MRKFLLATAAASFGMVIAAPAFAQDGPPVAGPFTGFRAEALAGYDTIRDGENDSEGRDGVVYGGAIGYDFDAGGLVIGAEGEITGSTIKARANNLIAAGDNFRLKTGRDLYAGGRIGYAVSPQTLLYAKAGYTNARLEGRYTRGNTVVIDKADLDGFRVGAGAEYQMASGAYIKAEYRYSNYGNFEGYDIDLDRHQVVAGVGFRF